MRSCRSLQEKRLHDTGTRAGELLSHGPSCYDQPMIVAVRLLLIAFLAFLALMLCGCFVGPLKPEVHRLDAAESDDARLDRVILTKRVVLERGKR